MLISYRFFSPLRSSLLFVLTLFSSVCGADQKGVVPKTSEELGQYVRSLQENVLQTIEQIGAIPNDQKTPQNTMRPWNRLTSRLLEDMSLLTYLVQTNHPLQAEAKHALYGSQAFLFKSFVCNPSLHLSFLGYAERILKEDVFLTLSENYELICLLESCEKIREFLPKEERNALDQLKALSLKREKSSFTYLRGSAREKAVISDELSILTLNTCFLPGVLPLLFGGVLPWDQRVSSLAEKVLSLDPDIVCLQEVFTEDAGFVLYDKLKSRYAHFYSAIGRRPLGFSLEMLGLPSGLFVASKYPLENPHFTLFSHSGFPVNYGFFDFLVKAGNTTLGHIYTTHLQSLNEEQFSEIRAAQLQEIIGKMHVDFSCLQKKNVPFLLCGDLNIPRGSQERGETLIKSYFYDAYNPQNAEVCESNRTCTDYFINYYAFSDKDPQKIDPNFQILDYSLLLSSLPLFPEQLMAQGCTIRTQLIPMNDLSHPELAISDHHGLLTHIRGEH